MNCVLMYNYQEVIKLKSCSTIDVAKEHIASKDGQSGYSNFQILVDYTAVEIYKEKFEILFDKLLNSANGTDIKPVLRSLD